MAEDTDLEIDFGPDVWKVRRLRLRGNNLSFTDKSVLKGHESAVRGSPVSVIPTSFTPIPQSIRFDNAPLHLKEDLTEAASDPEMPPLFPLPNTPDSDTADIDLGFSPEDEWESFDTISYDNETLGYAKPHLSDRRLHPFRVVSWEQDNETLVFAVPYPTVVSATTPEQALSLLASEVGVAFFNLSQIETPNPERDSTRYTLTQVLWEGAPCVEEVETLTEKTKSKTASETWAEQKGVPHLEGSSLSAISLPLEPEDPFDFRDLFSDGPNADSGTTPAELAAAIEQSVLTWGPPNEYDTFKRLTSVKIPPPFPCEVSECHVYAATQPTQIGFKEVPMGDLVLFNAHYVYYGSMKEGVCHITCWNFIPPEYPQIEWRPENLSLSPILAKPSISYPQEWNDRSNVMRAKFRKGN